VLFAGYIHVTKRSFC